MLRVTYTSGEIYGHKPQSTFLHLDLVFSQQNLKQKFDLSKTLDFRNWLPQKKNKNLRITVNPGQSKGGFVASARDIEIQTVTIS